MCLLYSDETYGSCVRFAYSFTIIRDREIETNTSYYFSFILENVFIFFFVMRNLRYSSATFTFRWTFICCMECMRYATICCSTAAIVFLFSPACCFFFSNTIRETQRSDMITSTIHSSIHPLGRRRGEKVYKKENGSYIANGTSWWSLRLISFSRPTTHTHSTTSHSTQREKNRKKKKKKKQTVIRCRLGRYYELFLSNQTIPHGTHTHTHIYRQFEAVTNWTNRK